MWLDRIGPGKAAMVEDLQVGEILQGRLKDFGFVPGTRVICRYRSPGGQVMAIECRGAVIALRTRDLGKIRVRDI